MKTNIKIGIAAMTCACLFSFNAKAIPYLTLDASGGIYDNTSSSTIAQSTSFTLYAMLNSLTPTAGDTFAIVAAVQPKTSTPQNLGSMIFNGTTVNVTSGMTYGNPVGPPHGIYQTYYSLFSFAWNPANTFNAYDPELVSGTHTGPTPAKPGNALYMSFNVNVGGLATGTALWFDLVEMNAAGQVVNNEPFSEAVQSSHGTGSITPVPDAGSTALLLGAALSGLGLLARRTK